MSEFRNEKPCTLIKEPCTLFDVDGVLVNHPPQTGEQLQSFIYEHSLQVDPEVGEIRIDVLAILIGLQKYNRQNPHQPLEIKKITQEVLRGFHPGTLIDEINHLLIAGNLVHNSELYIEIQSLINNYKRGPEYCEMVKLIAGAKDLPSDSGIITNNSLGTIWNYLQARDVLTKGAVFSGCDRGTPKSNITGWLASFGWWTIQQERKKQKPQTFNPKNLYQNLTELRHLFVGDQPKKDAAMTNNVNSWLKGHTNEQGNYEVQLKPEEWIIVRNFWLEMGATKTEIRMLLKLFRAGKDSDSIINVDYLHIAPPSEIKLHGIEAIRQELHNQFPNIPKINVAPDLVELAAELNAELKTSVNTVQENTVIKSELLPKPVRKILHIEIVLTRPELPTIDNKPIPIEGLRERQSARV
jgi:hypothetical protein